MLLGDFGKRGDSTAMKKNAFAVVQISVPIHFATEILFRIRLHSLLTHPFTPPPPKQPPTAHDTPNPPASFHNRNSVSPSKPLHRVAASCCSDGACRSLRACGCNQKAGSGCAFICVDKTASFLNMSQVNACTPLLASIMSEPLESLHDESGSA